MLEFNSRVLPIKFNGKQYQVNYPTVNDIVDYTDKLEKKDAKEINIVKSLLEKLGLPENVTGQMEIDNLKIIIEELVKQKK